MLCSTLLLLLVSCDYYKNYKLDGMWQLKTVQDTDGNITCVDTIYYSFHREVVFSLTVLLNPKQARPPFYGYIEDEKISDNKIHIKMDRKVKDNYSEEDDNKELNYVDDFTYFLSFSGWSSADIVFDIKKYNKSDLVLFDSKNEKTYTLKKF